MKTLFLPWSVETNAVIIVKLFTSCIHINSIITSLSFFIAHTITTHLFCCFYSCVHILRSVVFDYALLAISWYRKKEDRNLHQFVSLCLNYHYVWIWNWCWLNCFTSNYTGYIRLSDLWIQITIRYNSNPLLFSPKKQGILFSNLCQTLQKCTFWKCLGGTFGCMKF